MDAKITKVRLGRMLSYDWIKIIGFAAAAIVVWVLIFTMTATRITPAQQFTVMNYLGNTALTRGEFGDSCDKAFGGGKGNGIFSYEVLEINNVDLAANSDAASDLLTTRISTEEGDVVFAANVKNADTETKNEETGETTYKTYLDQFVYSYRYTLYNLDPTAEKGYFKQMESYLNEYFNGDWENGALNEEKAFADFRTRVKGDKRYKKESQLLQGEQDEKDRLNKYRTALKKFYWYLDEGTVSITTTTVPSSKEGEADFVGTYAINLCPDTEKMPNLYKLVGYYATQMNEETGKEESALTAKDMNVCFFDFDGVEESFEYENLLYVVYLIDSYAATPYPSANA